ncbi:MAG: acyl-CoA dehydrogenase family protein [Nocardioidaceae bacterium]
MDFEFDAEQLALRDAVRALLTDQYASIDGRRAATAKDPGFDEGTWAKLAEMGVLGLPFSEEAGGMGAGPAEVAVVAGELGRVCAPDPFVEVVVLAGGLIAAAGGDVSGIADGSVIAAFAHDGGEVTAVASGDGWTLRGSKEPVLNGGRADVIVVSAQVDGHPALFQVDGSAVTRTSYATFDGGRASAIAFDAVSATPLGDPSTDATPLIEQAVALARIAYAHEAVGAMQTSLDLTTEYLRTRKQFGVPLKTFQALTFRAADMYVSLELATSVASWATLVALDGSDPAQLVDAGRRAKLQAGQAGRHVSKESIQLHGGIGMTMEYAVGHYAMRLTAIDHTLGDGRDQLRELAAQVGDYGVLEPLP